MEYLNLIAPHAWPLIFCLCFALHILFGIWANGPKWKGPRKARRRTLAQMMRDGLIELREEMATYSQVDCIRLEIVTRLEQVEKALGVNQAPVQPVIRHISECPEFVAMRSEVVKLRSHDAHLRSENDRLLRDIAGWESDRKKLEKTIERMSASSSRKSAKNARLWKRIRTLEEAQSASLPQAKPRNQAAYDCYNQEQAAKQTPYGSPLPEHDEFDSVIRALFASFKEAGKRGI